MEGAGAALSVGFVITFLSVVVALPIAALIWFSPSQESSPLNR